MPITRGGEGVAGLVGDEEEDAKVEEGKEVNQVAPGAEDLIEHSFNQGDILGSISEEEVDIIPKSRNLGKKKAAGAELVQQTPDPILAFPSPTEGQSNVLSSQHASKRKGKLPSFPAKEGEEGWLLGCPLKITDVPRIWAPKFAVVQLGKIEGVQRLDDHVEHSELIAIHARNEAEAALAQMNKALQELAELNADVGAIQGNELGGGEGEEAGDTEGGVDEGNPITPPAE
ncbi:hypothetical protein Acr_14g0006220 [Actinidia rufa]|uniref:Uncharacterized protein n=1 Tax=Actinidia rufa TaxID=165716 RepID=A0A7J0FRF7_9ERIC|nr:hypothetical protein Acr_14g0006220 [Actinidia rufa]